MSSNEELLIYNLYYIVNSGLQVFKFKIRGYKMCTAFLMKIRTNRYRTIIKKYWLCFAGFIHEEND